jgi:hypothetical protein
MAFGLPEGLNAGEWLNSEDFAKALTAARTRYPQPPLKAAPPEQPRESVSRLNDSAPVEPPKPPAQKFNMRVVGWPAKFLPPWRARVRR